MISDKQGEQWVRDVLKRMSCVRQDIHDQEKTLTRKMDEAKIKFEKNYLALATFMDNMTEERCLHDGQNMTEFIDLSQEATSAGQEYVQVVEELGKSSGQVVKVTEAMEYLEGVRDFLAEGVPEYMAGVTKPEEFDFSKFQNIDFVICAVREGIDWHTHFLAMDILPMLKTWGVRDWTIRKVLGTLRREYTPKANSCVVPAIGRAEGAWKLTDYGQRRYVERLQELHSQLRSQVNSDD